ncbi:butyrophilin-like protein 8 isoform X2 [Notamacropus eugenii]|uniref:butyrophilin-like protein 8 isoform X2 n=1 Tax=Notamacropus eugenii TaxID=9315 RepID=UPI003B672915
MNSLLGRSPENFWLFSRNQAMNCITKWNPWPDAHSSPTLTLCLGYLILQLPCIPGSGTFTVSGPLTQPTLAWVGEDVLLPCHLSPMMDAQEMTVKWVRGSLVVHMYHMHNEMMVVQAPLFKGRTKMLRQDMAEGKVTVRINHVQLSDAGRYTCFFQAGTFYSEASFDLQVAERQKQPFSVTGPAQLIQVNQGEDVTLSCKLSPKMDAQDMTVNWFRNKTLMYKYPIGKKLEESQGSDFQGRMELPKYNKAEGKVTLRIQQVQVSDSGPYTCQLQSSDYHSEAHMELQVEGNYSTSQKTLPIIITAVFLFVFICFFLVIYFFCKTKLQTTKEEIIPRWAATKGGQRSTRDLPASPGKLQLPCRPIPCESLLGNICGVLGKHLISSAVSAAWS